MSDFEINHEGGISASAIRTVSRILKCQKVIIWSAISELFVIVVLHFFFAIKHPSKGLKKNKNQQNKKIGGTGIHKNFGAQGGTASFTCMAWTNKELHSGLYEKGNQQTRSGGVMTRPLCMDSRRFINTGRALSAVDITPPPSARQPWTIYHLSVRRLPAHRDVMER